MVIQATAEGQKNLQFYLECKYGIFQNGLFHNTGEMKLKVFTHRC